jgi:hypothetical protein
MSNLNMFESSFLVTKSEFEESFNMSLEGDCFQVEFTPNMELLVTLGMLLWAGRKFFMSFIHNFT